MPMQNSDIGRIFERVADPTGRLINSRQPYPLDMEKIMRAARENNCFLEASANPDRLDIDDIYCKMAREMGVKVALSTDSHSIAELDSMHYGLGQVRRGWLQPDDIINTRTLPQLRKLLRRQNRRCPM